MPEAGPLRNSAIWDWISQCLVDYRIEPKSVDIKLSSTRPTSRFTWHVVGAYPTRWAVSDLNASSNAVVVESPQPATSISAPSINPRGGAMPIIVDEVVISVEVGNAEGRRVARRRRGEPRTGRPWSRNVSSGCWPSCATGRSRKCPRPTAVPWKTDDPGLHHAGLFRFAGGRFELLSIPTKSPWPTSGIRRRPGRRHHQQPHEFQEDEAGRSGPQLLSTAPAPTATPDVQDKIAEFQTVTGYNGDIHRPNYPEAGPGAPSRSSAAS